MYSFPRQSFFLSIEFSGLLCLHSTRQCEKYQYLFIWLKEFASLLNIYCWLIGFFWFKYLQFNYSGFYTHGYNDELHFKFHILCNYMLCFSWQIFSISITWCICNHKSESTNTKEYIQIIPLQIELHFIMLCYVFLIIHCREFDQTWIQLLSRNFWMSQIYWKARKDLEVLEI